MAEPEGAPGAGCCARDNADVRCSSGTPVMWMRSPLDNRARQPFEGSRRASGKGDKSRCVIARRPGPTNLMVVSNMCE